MRRVSARLRLEDAPTAIRPTSLEDCDEQLALRRANREHTKPWDPTRDESFYTVAGQRLELELDQRAWAAGSAFAFAVLAADRARPDHRARRARQRRARPLAERDARLLDRQGLGRPGHASRAVRLALAYAFDHVGLHRVQPAIIPRNTASTRVAQKVGFRHEGRALRYLKINGVWEDHDIYALTSEDWQAMQAR